MSNRRYPAVFVLSNVGTMFVTDNTKKPRDLTSGQLGVHLSDQFEIPGVGTGASPDESVNAIVLHQSLGDNRFGTLRSKPIERAKVRRYYGETASTGQTAITYIGYDEVDNTKDIDLPCGKEIAIKVGVSNNGLLPWYNHKPGYWKTIVLNTGCCNADNDNADKDDMADYIVGQINNTLSPANDYPASNELPNYVVATKVTTGTQGQADYRVGVKITSIAITPDLINLCDPLQFAEVNLTQIYVGIDAGRECADVAPPVTVNRVAKPGKGYPAFLAQEEKEWQGYNRVREVYEDPRYMKLANHIILAADGVKYDSLYLEFDWTHDNAQSAATQKQITDPYIIKIAGPTTTMQTVADVFNSWLDGKFPYVTF
jgi:hypothetical protein